MDVAWNRGADEVITDAEQSQQHRVVAHRLGKVSDPSHLSEEPVDGGQDVPDEEQQVGELDDFLKFVAVLSQIANISSNHVF